MDIGHLKVVLELNSAQYTEGIKRARKDGRDLSDGMEQISAAAKVMGMAVAAGASVAAVGMAALVKSQIDAADAAGKMASKYGSSTEAISELTYAAKLSDVAIESVGQAMLHTQKAAVDAAGGSKELQTAFGQLGINVQEFVNLSPDRQLEAMADALQGVQNVSQRNALAMQIMGKSATDLADLMKDGSAGIRELRDEANRLGLTVSGDTAARAAYFNDNIERLKSTLSGAAMEIANNALPALNRITEAMVSGARQSGMWEAAVRGANAALQEMLGIAGEMPNERLLDAKVKIRDLKEELKKYEVILAQPGFDKNPAFNYMQQGAERVRQKLAEARGELERITNPPQQKPTASSFIAPSKTSDAGNDEEIKRKRFQDLQASFSYENKALSAKYASELQIIKDSESLKDVTEAERNVARLQAKTEFEQGLTEIERKEAEKRQQIERQLTDAKMRLNGMAYQSAVGLLRAIPGATKAAAIAGIAIQKWSAIQAAKSSALAASNLAFASQLVPGDPSSLARAEAARAAALAEGSTTVAAITAMEVGAGVLEAANVLGSASSPTASGTVTSSGGQQVVTPGGVYGADQQSFNRTTQVQIDLSSLKPGQYDDTQVRALIERIFEVSRDMGGNVAVAFS